MKKLLLTYIGLVLAVSVAFSQHFIKGEKSQMTKQATIRVSELKQVNPEETTVFKVPNKEWKVPEWKVDKDDVIFMEPKGFRDKATRSVTENSPAPDTTFHALADNGSSIPPDVNGAAGPDNLMITLNTQVRIQDREGNNLFTTSLHTFWEGLPGNGDTFDPKVVYDPYADRWIIVTPSSSDLLYSRLYVGVSATSDPMGEWYMFWLDPDPQNQTWFDYPSFGFNKKWITISGNMFGNNYYRTVFVIDKMALYDGDEAPSYTRFATTEGFTLVPSVTYDTTVEDMYLICTSNGNSGGNGYIKKFKVSGEVNDPVFEYEGAIGVPEPWSNGAGQNGDFLPQLGSSQLINSVDSRMETVIYRNNKLWAVHHIFLPANNPQRTAIQWWELDTDGNILQRGRVDDTTNLFSFAFPSIAVNANEDIMIGYGVFSSTQYAGAGYSFKAYYDDDNTIRNYYQYKEGENPYYKTYGGGRNRWGDYTATCVDPVNDYDFWTLQEYSASPENKWGTWWAYLRPSFAPVANFTSDVVLIPVGEKIDFTDLTAGIPTTWQWTFENGTPDTSPDQNPADIQFNTEGTFDVSLIVSNDLGEDTITKEGYITTSSTLLPEIEFTYDQPKVCLGEPVHFTDKTIYSPNQWDWQFTPSTVSFINETNQNSQNPVVVFNEAGSYTLTLTVWNLNGSADTIAYDIVLAGGINPYYKETFDIDQFSINSWTVENPDDDVTWELFEVGGSGPDNLAAGIDFSKYYLIGQRDRLISPSFNLTGLGSAALEFQHAYAKKHDEITDSLIVLVSGDCGENWTRIFAAGEDGSGNFATHEKTDSFWPENYWDWCGSGYGASCVDIDLTPWAGMADVRIAFESYSGYGNPMFIDNIELSQYTSQEELEKNPETISIFPNPSDGTFTVLFNENSSYDQLEIYNQMGQLVRHMDIENGSNMVKFNTLKNLIPGIYIIKIKGLNGNESKRLVIY